MNYTHPSNYTDPQWEIRYQQSVASALADYRVSNTNPALIPPRASKRGWSWTRYRKAKELCTRTVSAVPTTTSP